METMRTAKSFIITGIFICSMAILAGCAGFQGKAYERLPDGGIGPTIAGVEITFRSEDSSSTHIATTNNVGYYGIDLIPQRYVVTATHPHYGDYSSAPGFFVVTGGGYQTGNIFLKKSVDLLMITTSLLQAAPVFDEVVNQYKTTLMETEGLNAAYIELDSDETQGIYGTKVNDPSDWNEVRAVLQELIQITGATYIMVLGGPLVVPRPAVDACCNSEGAPVTVPSDAWYLDSNNDQIVDEGLTISRLPDLSYNSTAVIEALQTAMALHNEGGYTLDNEVRFTLYDYTTPPYGVCDECGEMEAFFGLMSTSDYIVFAGHGSPTAIYSNVGVLKFSIDYMSSIDLQDNHPVIIAYFPCSAGGLYPSSSNLSYEFIKAGAAAYIARTTTQGTPGYVVNNFPSDIEEGMRIGPALHQSMRQTVLEHGDTFKASAAHICLYGDPTLRRH